MCLLHEGGENPAGVGQDVGEEEVGVDLVPQAAHLPREEGRFRHASHPNKTVEDGIPYLRLTNK